MSSTHITIVGVGALGSHAALLLRNLDARITVVDFDRVEKKNTLSQFHSRMGIGRNKAVALAQSLQGLWGLRVHAIPHRLVEDNASVLLGDADLILDCLDNGVSRRLVQTWAQQLGTPCLHGALAPEGQFGQVVWDTHFRVDDEPTENRATCEDGTHLPFIVLCAARMAQSVGLFLAEGEKQSFHLFPTGMTRVS